MIPFNKPFLSGNESLYIQQAVASGKISGDGLFTKKCHNFFESHFGFKKALLTTSCTDALEMAAILLDIEAGDEVIIPSYTFVSTANAFVLRGAKIVFADVCATHPCLDTSLLETLITPATKAIVAVHYAGVACDMDAIMGLANKYGIYVVEDAAQAVDSYYTGENGAVRPLGSIGHLGAFSFHETKNLIAGEGGMLTVNDERFVQRAEIIREKGTNRSAFFRGESARYDWMDIGSSFLPSDIIAAFLYAQLENLQQIQKQRLFIWQTYRDGLQAIAESGFCQLPFIPEYATNNGSMFYLLCRSRAERDALIEDCRRNNILAVFHYLPLHKSPYYSSKHDGRLLPNTDRFAECLVRLPFYYEITSNEMSAIINLVHRHYTNPPRGQW